MGGGGVRGLRAGGGSPVLVALNDTGGVQVSALALTLQLAPCQFGVGCRVRVYGLWFMV